jgi:hypothetical protein
MSVNNKKFYDLRTGQVVQIKDHFEDIAILNDNSKVRMTRLMDKNYYDEYVDPTDFMRNDNLLNNFAQKIRQIPDSAVQSMGYDVSEQYQHPNFQNNNNRPVDLNNLSGVGSFNPVSNESAVIQYDPEQEKADLLRKAQTMFGNGNNVNVDRFKNLIDEEDIPVIQPFNQRNQVQTPIPQPQEDQVQRIEVVRDDSGDVIREDVQQDIPLRREPQVQPQVQVYTSSKIEEDPIIQMFRNVKRNTSFKLNFLFENKIPRPDFIEMMEDSYNTSIIDFLADEFMKEILNNPDLIKGKIKDEINKMVYKSEAKVEKVATPKKEKKELPKPTPPTPPEDRILVEGKEPPKPTRTKKSQEKND